MVWASASSLRVAWLRAISIYVPPCPVVQFFKLITTQYTHTQHHYIDIGRIIHTNTTTTRLNTQLLKNQYDV